jgi:hypothetical protein
MPLDFENRHMRTIGSNQDRMVSAMTLAGLFCPIDRVIAKILEYIFSPFAETFFRKKECVKFLLGLVKRLEDGELR